MRKKSKYKPKPVIVNAWERLVQGSQSISQNFKHQLLVLQIKPYAALDSMKKGTGTWDDANTIVHALNISEAYARHGHGSDWLPEIRSGQRALHDAMQRAVKMSRITLKGEEMKALGTAIDVHNEQLENSTVLMLEKMVDYVTSELGAGRADKLPIVAL